MCPADLARLTFCEALNHSLYLHPGVFPIIKPSGHDLLFARSWTSSSDGIEIGVRLDVVVASSSAWNSGSGLVSGSCSGSGSVSGWGTITKKLRGQTYCPANVLEQPASPKCSDMHRLQRYNLQKT